MLAEGANDLRKPESQSLVYAQLRMVAKRVLRGERSNHTLQPTALVHEAWLRLARRRDAAGLSQDRFVALATTTMRRVLVDSARRRGAARRDSGRRVDLPDAAPAEPRRAPALVALDDALQALASADPGLARLVELRVFGGHDVREIGTLLGLSSRTVKRRWHFARSWLAREMRRRLL